MAARPAKAHLSPPAGLPSDRWMAASQPLDPAVASVVYNPRPRLQLLPCETLAPISFLPIPISVASAASPLLLSSALARRPSSASLVALSGDGDSKRPSGLRPPTVGSPRTAHPPQSTSLPSSPPAGRPCSTSRSTNRPLFAIIPNRSSVVHARRRLTIRSGALDSQVCWASL
jgi:hypothetical protein